MIDPKGENASITARARALGSHVHIINPWNELGDAYARLGFAPATYNPLDILRADDPNVVSIAQSLAASMSPATGQREAFWASSAANIIAAVMLWLTDHREEQKTLGRLADILGRSKNRSSKIMCRKWRPSPAIRGSHPQTGRAVSGYAGRDLRGRHEPYRPGHRFS